MQPVVYALEGAVGTCGSLMKWLRDSLKLITRDELTQRSAEWAHAVGDTGDVYLVPAFSGLLAPRWRPDARGVLVRAGVRLSNACLMALMAIDGY